MHNAWRPLRSALAVVVAGLTFWLGPPALAQDDQPDVQEVCIGRRTPACLGNPTDGNSNPPATTVPAPTPVVTGDDARWARVVN